MALISKKKQWNKKSLLDINPLNNFKALVSSIPVEPPQNLLYKKTRTFTRISKDLRNTQQHVCKNSVETQCLVTSLSIVVTID